MANTLKRLVPKVRLEATTGLGSGTNTAHVLHLEAEDKSKEFYLIFGDGAPGSDYDTAPAGSIYVDYTNSALYVSDGAGTWAAK